MFSQIERSLGCLLIYLYLLLYYIYVGKGPVDPFKYPTVVLVAVVVFIFIITYLFRVTLCCKPQKKISIIFRKVILGKKKCRWGMEEWPLRLPRESSFLLINHSYHLSMFRGLLLIISIIIYEGIDTDSVLLNLCSYPHNWSSFNHFNSNLWRYWHGFSSARD